MHLGLSKDDKRPDSVPSFNVRMDAPENPIQVLFKDEGIERRLSVLFQSVFGVEVILNRSAGTFLPLHCGKRPQLEDGEDRASRGYVDRLFQLPLLNDQGHGMRSFAGCLMATLASPSLVQLIDEPEAFLHPPQARLIGNLFATEKPDWRQLIMATHSGDLLRGVLDSESKNVNIIRLTRAGTANRARQLDVDDIRRLWSDPILRFSNVLDGLFHDSVVVCESDADCRFYAAVLKAIDGPDEPQPDAFFASSGGKDRVP